jgi:hypothetical protein
MIMTGRTPRFRANKYLHALIVVIDDNVDLEVAATLFLQKMKLITNIHENVFTQCGVSTKETEENPCY